MPTSFYAWIARGAAVLAAAALPFLAGPLAPGAPALAAPALQTFPPSPARSLRSVEAGYGFLMDRYVTAPDPAKLLDAAWGGALEALPQEKRLASPIHPVAGDRAGAWADFSQRFQQAIDGGADADALARAANRAMARSLDDCHTRFAESYEKEIASYEGTERYGGIGASALDATRFDPLPPGPVIISLVEGAPAARSGLRLGDAVIGVDGTDTTGWTNSRVVELVRGTPGTTVVLRVDRPGTTQPVEIAIQREEIDYALVEHRLLPGAAQENVGYVQLKGFSRAAEPAMPEAFEALRAQGAEGWILDLRNNGGGSVLTFTAIASLLIPEGTLGVTVDRGGAESYITATGGAHKPYVRPLAVLVNALSASASELLAADLQEYGVARVFGDTTSGCFGNSQLFRIPDGSAMWITTRALQSGKERRDVHKQGVTPDEEVRRTRADLAAGDDPQLAAALAWLADQRALHGVPGEN
jgi:carboxyl-terminal processing protease